MNLNENVAMSLNFMYTCIISDQILRLFQHPLLVRWYSCQKSKLFTFFSRSVLHHRFCRSDWFDAYPVTACTEELCSVSVGHRKLTRRIRNLVLRRKVWIKLFMSYLLLCIYFFFMISLECTSMEPLRWCSPPTWVLSLAQCLCQDQDKDQYPWDHQVIIKL